MKLKELLIPEELQLEVDRGYVSKRVHPRDADLIIYNYTDKAQYEKHWNHVTLHTRGLIVKYGEIVARGWEKFFNATEVESLDWDDPCGWVLTDKIDGSLGIVYHGPDGWAVATRGSFDSEQAIAATEMLQTEEKYKRLIWDAALREPYGITELVEIIYPENRIVLDYGRERKLVRLGRVFADGFTQQMCQDQAYLTVSTLNEALEHLHRENAEGWVAHRMTDGFMVKLKQEDYLLKHRARFGLNNKIMWRTALNSEEFDALRKSIPDEYMPWWEATLEALMDDAKAILMEAIGDHWRLTNAHDDLKTRAQQADWIKREAVYPHLVFALLDGKNVASAIWKMIEPKELEWATPIAVVPETS